jgi:acyl-coenzyme A synthetase/AMP-(fatty) acid ligase
MTTVVPEVALRASAGLGSSWSADFSKLSTDELERLLTAEGDLCFSTSGTSGHPVSWIRTACQLIQEAQVTLDVLGRHYDAVHSTVPTQSLYGYAAVLVAAQLQIPYLYDRLGIRRLSIHGIRPLVFSIPPSWQTLPATLADFFDDTGSDGGTLTVVHAGARLPRPAYNTVDLLQHRGHRICGVELFGASETGLVAARKFSLTSETPWTITPDVEVLFPGQDTTRSLDGEESVHPITVRSPRIGRRAGTSITATAVSTDDLVTTVQGETMRIVGRAGRRFKPGGRWVDLDHLDDQLRDLLPRLKFATVPVDDPVLGEHVELFVDPAAGLDTDVLHRWLRNHSDHLDLVPVRVQDYATLETSHMGKIFLSMKGIEEVKPA